MSKRKSVLRGSSKRKNTRIFLILRVFGGGLRGKKQRKV